MTTPTLRQLEYAVAVADHQHFGRAAEVVHVSQPGLSAQIQQLEKHLGVQLFERRPRGVLLTSSGTELTERARGILRAVEELTVAASIQDGTLRGTLRLAAIPTIAPYLLPDLVQTFRKLWPDLDLVIQEMQTTDMVTAIENGEVDLGLLAVPIETGSLHVESLFDEPFLLAMPEDHELAGTSPLPLAALTALPVLLLEEGHCLREHAVTACEIAGQVNATEVQSASLSTLTQMVAAGVGVTLLPAGAVPIECRPGTGLTTRPLESPTPGRTIALAWRTTDPRGPHFAVISERGAGALH